MVLKARFDRLLKFRRSFAIRATRTGLHPKIAGVIGRETNKLKSSLCALLCHCFSIHYYNQSPRCQWQVVDIYLAP